LKDRFRIVTTSLLGCGGTAERRTDGDTSIDHEADIVEAVIARTGSPVHLIGHSFGGPVVLAAALRGRARLKSLILIDGNACDLLRQNGDLELYAEVRAMSAAYIAAYRAGEQDAARRVIDFWTGAGSFDRLPAKLRDYALLTTPANILDWPSMFGFDCAIDDYAAFDLPVLVVHGANSHTATRRVAEIMARIFPRSRLVSVADASHLLIGTHPREVAALIAAHVAATEG
jgi:pimeloyl-ACP methyl ester carboxylesterase